MKLGLSLFVIILIVVGIWLGISGGTEPNSQNEQNKTEVKKQEAYEPNKSPLATKPQPIIIWHFSTCRDSLSSLELALSSGLVNHVSIGGTLHRSDKLNWKKMLKAFKAVQIAKKAGMKTIWIRWLWPGYTIKRLLPCRATTALGYLRPHYNGPYP